MFLAGEVEESQDEPYTEENDDLYFDLPPILTVKEAAEFLRVSTHTVYEMCRVYHGKFFPHFKIGNQIKIPRDKFVEWIKNGGINNYKENVASEDSKRHTQKVRESKAENMAKSLSKNENSKKFETKEHEKKLEEKEVLNKKEASKYLGISTAKISQLLKDEKVLYTKRDTRYIIPKIALDTYINSKGQVSWQDQVKKYSEHKCRI
ncbi:helix-turn-helix domain-containing protein [Natranaerofaba carboxydovora]|uniref:helix-turn-helix domain-containing protein n=1 Tax=Natranaerofaba carboxydovora TaxID=2742683 RepID=UPI001F1382D4|nr:helix-turn-helix domain-containing protein [Natranaerofaba carboxydovora]UMZ72538.1 Helix-turn-helix domain protein [Natranaerofaba carboxydovora]